MSKLDPIQLEQLKEIGVHLHQTREQQSKSLEEVAAKTFIPLRLLQAIEIGQATVLPEPIFIQGFIRRYGDVVGLDGIALSKQFSLDTTAVPVKPEPPKAPPPQFTDRRAIALPLIPVQNLSTHKRLTQPPLTSRSTVRTQSTLDPNNNQLTQNPPEPQLASTRFMPSTG
ncbi:MAG: hypothetical protein HC899_02170 [Leptolyngbyaceae cyanobacterium SM1_4_3]|nr:hypothetical protein [Leptolyngbyaceae cyanobacterium SM1_4_3]